MTFFEFLSQAISSPALLVTTLLTLGVILVNGWTDAPNAIATCVSTRCMGVRAAVLMAAACNFVGVLVMTAVSSQVVQTIYNMADFGGDSKRALVALCAAMVAIVLWATAAWYFGIPTSESHALIAGVSGAAIALNGGFSGINADEWMKVIYGLVLSTLLGFFSGMGVAKGVGSICKNMQRGKTNAFFKYAQISGGGAMAFMHGAQDGQKFIGIFLLGMSLASDNAEAASFDVPLWLIVLCSAVMGLGTSIGGYKIIKSVGMDMVKLEKYEGFSADLAGAFCLLLSTVTGLPVSTTHTKTTAIMGVGAARRLSKVNWGVVKDMSFAWILTFPGCGLIGYITANIFIKVFA